jgi:hypothetical protein
MKEREIFFTNDVWHVAVDFDLRTYHYVAAAIKSDLLIVEQRRQEFTPVRELKQINLLLQTLEFS